MDYITVHSVIRVADLLKGYLHVQFHNYTLKHIVIPQLYICMTLKNIKKEEEKKIERMTINEWVLKESQTQMEKLPNYQKNAR